MPAHRRLRRRQRVQMPEHRSQEVGQRGESQLRLGFRATGPHHHDRIATALDQRLEQRGLADPSLAVYDQGAAIAADQRGKQIIEPAQLGHPAYDQSVSPQRFRPLG